MAIDNKRLTLNTKAVKLFKTDRPAYSESVSTWTTHCKVIYKIKHETQGKIEVLSDTLEVSISTSKGKYSYLELFEGRKINEHTVGQMRFSAAEATFIYDNSVLIIRSSNAQIYNEVSIGEYDDTYVRD